MVVVALSRFSECKDSFFLFDVGELQLRELLVENPLDLSFVLDVSHPSLSTRLLSYLDRFFHVATYDM